MFFRFFNIYVCRLHCWYIGVNISHNVLNFVSIFTLKYLLRYLHNTVLFKSWWTSENCVTHFNWLTIFQVSYKNVAERNFAQELKSNRKNKQFHTVSTILKSNRKNKQFHTVSTILKSNRKNKQFHTVSTILKSNRKPSNSTLSEQF
jgi:hypothetical protein